MIDEYLLPLHDSLLNKVQLNIPNSFGEGIKLHTSKSFPNLSKAKIAILGIAENRGAQLKNSYKGLYLIRKELYKLFSGQWHLQIVDLGNIKQGESVEDTYFALSSTVSLLVRKGLIPIIIGGSQDLTYANYKAYYALEQTVNLASIDSRFDLGTLATKSLSQSFLSKIIVEQPNNLFNFSNIGYQTHFNSQREIQLINQLYFDAYRLGEINKDLCLVEPILRDADIVSFDISSIRQADAPASLNSSPNGFYSEQACAIARYAGISDKVSSFGIYEYLPELDIKNLTAKLIAQIIWYFIEGVNNRANDYPYSSKEICEKFTVVLEHDEPLNFYKSTHSGRWWMEINVISNNKHKRHALIPCSYQDYKEALSLKIPKRWFKAAQKFT
ncbi:MAG: formimidoylglutamase [Tenacibaculum sp.]